MINIMCNVHIKLQCLQKVCRICEYADDIVEVCTGYPISVSELWNPFSAGHRQI